MLPAVTLSIAKRKGTNAIDVADAVIAKVEHLRGTVDRDHLLHVRSDRLRELAGAAPEIADNEGLIDEAEDRPEIELIAEETASQPIPPAGRRREKFL